MIFNHARLADSQLISDYEDIFHNVLHKIALFCRKLLIENVSLA